MARARIASNARDVCMRARASASVPMARHEMSTMCALVSQGTSRPRRSTTATVAVARTASARMFGMKDKKHRAAYAIVDAVRVDASRARDVVFGCVALN